MLAIVTPSFTFKQIPGIQILSLWRPQRPRGIVVWDVNRTLVHDQPIGHELSMVARDTAGLAPDLVLAALDPEQRLASRHKTGHDPGGIEGFFAMIARNKADKFAHNPQRLLDAMLAFQSKAVSLERPSPFSGIREAISIARRWWPDVLHIACTYSPCWQTELRLVNAELMELLDGYVALRHSLPEAAEHPHPELLTVTHQWIDELERRTRHASARLFLRVGLPIEYAKPSPSTVYALSNFFGVPVYRILVVDDHSSGLKMAAAAGAVGLHADYASGPSLPFTRATTWAEATHRVTMPPGVVSVMSGMFGPPSDLFV